VDVPRWLHTGKDSLLRFTAHDRLLVRHCLGANGSRRMRTDDRPWTSIIAVPMFQRRPTSESEAKVLRRSRDTTGFQLCQFRTRLVYKREQDRYLIIEGLLKAGLPT
jgi:hypothetical protein